MVRQNQAPESCGQEIRQIPLAEFWKVIFPFGSSEDGVMAVIVQYLDESADEKREKVYAVAGYYGNQFDWLAVERKWEECLENVRTHLRT